MRYFVHYFLKLRSKILMAKLQRDVLPLKSSSSSQVRFFAGHTRFATSSRADFDGTHPHSWSPPRPYSFYNLKKKSTSLGFNPDSPQNIIVENFISHNGGKFLSIILRFGSTFIFTIIFSYILDVGCRL